MRDNTPLPTGMAIERDVFLPGWEAVKDLNGHQLGRKIEAAKWNFFYLAGELKVTVLGRNKFATLRKAVKRALAKRVDQKLNSLQITKVVAKRFLGIPLVTLTAHSRHIQESIFLVPIKDALWGTRPLAAPETGLSGSAKPHEEKAITSRDTALISSS